MPDIDPSKIRPGDTVRVRMHTLSMQAGGVDPIEFVTKAYAGYGGATCVANSFLYVNPTALTILEHIPARPDWADALVVRDRGGKLWARSGRGESGKDECWSLIEKGLMGGAVIRTEDWHGPATVVLDADGNPPEPERSEDANCAWAAYRKAYAPNLDHVAAAHKAFHAGWDAHNPPPTPEPEWLDADALDELPTDAVILTAHSDAWPRWKGTDGRWRTTGVAEEGVEGYSSRELRKARVLWTPEGDR